MREDAVEIAEFIVLRYFELEIERVVSQSRRQKDTKTRSETSHVFERVLQSKYLIEVRAEEIKSC